MFYKLSSGVNKDAQNAHIYIYNINYARLQFISSFSKLYIALDDIRLLGSSERVRLMDLFGVNNGDRVNEY